MDTELWKCNIIDIIREISSEPFQRDAWFGKGEFESSPDEVFCQLFDDNMFEEFLKSPDVSISSKQRIEGELLRDKLEEYAQSTPGTLDPEVVINDPKWQEIREIAKKFLEF